MLLSTITNTVIGTVVLVVIVLVVYAISCSNISLYVPDHPAGAVVNGKSRP